MSLGEAFPAVLEACRAGADWAWRRLYDETAPAVLRYLRLSGARDPEDILGETFIRVVRALPTFVGDERAFRAWVFTIARRRSIDEARARGRHAVFAVPDEDLIANGDRGDVEDDALRSLATQHVASILQGLTRDQREVLVLRLLDGLTIEEIARILGKQPGAVKALQARGFAAIRREIAAKAVTF
jgi:RNA polymerase sigma-70 factor (ECF subfamily)